MSEFVIREGVRNLHRMVGKPLRPGDKDPFHGITHPPLFTLKIFGRYPFLWLWKKICCSHRWHLFDEVLTSSLSAEERACGLHEHNLYCDACGLTVNILSIMQEDEQVRLLLELGSG